ncbi:Thiol:disulfide interchange protein DsbB [Noviherbaspirillum humi]|uniref:Disulfide bond formation protein B n=1 Tax=Noviherbaspirillum humi TaxID=1688639 RepID=A0A239JBQ4_9BURK|nr:disulfide bond formation protein B [Noviherbaspirillum humi]SNT02858.1 Thiol:disulfide interchange protein DsbB [Noviherbaspirillum humi]
MTKNLKPILLLAAFICFALLGFALYLQHVKQMLPCPLCIMQRYAFAATGLICLVFAFLPRGASCGGAVLGALAALTGAGVAGWHLWVKAHPSVSCGIDPLETSLNKIPTAELLPFLFQADGLCTTEYAPIIGLSIPQWSMFWFLVLAFVLATAGLRRR